MRYLLTVTLLFLMATSIFAQTRRMNNIATAKTFAAQHQKRSIQPLLLEAEQKFRALDYDGTFLTLENAVAQNPYSPEALVVRAKFRKMVGMQTEAEADLRLANSLNPYAADLYGYNGNRGLLNVLDIDPESGLTGLSTFQKLKYYYEALDKKMSETNIDDEILLDIELGIEDIEANRLNQALDKINAVIEQAPGSALAYDLKGVIMKKRGMFEEARDAFTKAVELEPDFAIAWYNMAQIEKSLGNFEKAKTYLDRAINLQSDLTKAYFERALVLKKLGEKQQALEDYNKVIDLQSESSTEAFLNRGLTRKMLGDYGGALADLNQAVEDFPGNPELLKNRGNLHLLFGLPRKAIDDYTQAININPYYGEAYYNRALAHFLLYDKVSGCFDLDKSLEYNCEKAIEMQQYFCSQY